MSLDPALVEAAIRRKDSGAIRDLLKNATEADRRACGKALKDLLNGPGFPDDGWPIMVWVPRGLAPRLTPEQQREVAERQRRYEEQQRAYDEWREATNSVAFRLAAVGLAGGVAAAAEILMRMHYDHREPEDLAGLVIAVLADRRPDWLSELIDRHLTVHGFAAWQMARTLVRIGAIPRPSVPDYTTLMPSGAKRARWDPDHQIFHIQSPSEALLADPGLLDDEIWRLFTVPEAGKALERSEERARLRSEASQTWSQALAQLSADGHVDRDRLIDACLEAFTRDFNPNRVTWYAAMLAELDLSDDEVASRSSMYLGLLAATSKTAVTLGQAGARRLLDAGRLEAGKLLAASPPALLFPQKSIAMAQLKLIDKVVAQYPAAKSQATATVAVAFGHQRQDIQEAALALIARHGVPSGPALDEIRARVPDLSPALAARAAGLGLDTGRPAPEPSDTGEFAELERRIAALPGQVALVAAVSAARRGEVPGPAECGPGAGSALPPPIDDPDELVYQLSLLIEDAGDAIAVERALAGAVRLSAMPRQQRRQAAAPLLKRARQVMHDESIFSGDLITSDMALVTYAWAGEPLPEAETRREKNWTAHYAVGSAGQALTMAGIFSARAWEAARMIEAGRGGLLLAEPETDRGAISPDCLLDRVRRLPGRPRNQHDRDVALLRLAPGATDALWQAWAVLDGTAADAVRESYRVVTAPLRFETVAGTPAKRTYAREHLDPVLLARTAGQVRAAVDCPSWQLLTKLADPLADYVAMITVSEYERRYDQAVAGWSIICPWQPELAAAHLLRPLSAGLTAKTSPAATAVRSLRHPGHALGPVGHLALIEGMSGIEADTRIAAAEVWAAACADGRLDPALAAAALAAGSGSQVLKLNRVAESMERASHSALAARRVVETVCAATDLITAAPPNLHQLIELAARLGSSFGVPALPDQIRGLAASRRSARLNITAAQLVNAAEGQPAGQRQAAAQALTALITRAESLSGPTSGMSSR